MNIYYVLEILLGPAWESESGGILCEFMQRFDERLKEPGSLFCTGNHLSGAKNMGNWGK